MNEPSEKKKTVIYKSATLAQTREVYNKEAKVPGERERFNMVRAKRRSSLDTAA